MRHLQFAIVRTHLPWRFLVESGPKEAVHSAERVLWDRNTAGGVQGLGFRV